MNEIYSVSSLNTYIKSKFDNDFALKGIRLKGEISNFKSYPSGHIYFSLKDENSQIKAVMFSEFTRFLPANTKDGDEVVALGYVSVYPSRGEYQFYAQAIELSGAGAELLKLEELKKKLFLEGLFDESKKKQINIFPKAIGVISAPNSAAFSDIKKNLLRRYPLVNIILFASQVQGSDAPKQLLKALKEAENSAVDTIIIGRGGGSNEDLSAFNDETLVREAAKCEIPIISAIGHEIDYTLIDYVADKRASTPTGAAELAVVDKREIYQQLDQYVDELDTKINNIIRNYKLKLEAIASRGIYSSPKNIYSEKIEKLNSINQKIDLLINHQIDIYNKNILNEKKELEALSPKNVLSRGYSLMTTQEGKIIKSVKNVKLDQIVKLSVSDGTLTSKIINKELTTNDKN